MVYMQSHPTLEVLVLSHMLNLLVLLVEAAAGNSQSITLMVFIQLYDSIYIPHHLQQLIINT